MPAAFSTIRTRVQYLLGSNVAISTSEMNGLIQAQHESILNDNSWANRRAESVLNTTATYSTGTVGATGTAVTGSGTTFTAGMVGRWIRFGTDTTFYKITAFTSATSLTIEASVPTTVATGTTYIIFQHVYTLATDFDRPIAFAYRDPIVDRPRQELYRLDPIRSTVSTIPEFYSFRELSSSGYRQIEIWPIPSSAITIRYAYLKTNTLVDDADTPLYPSDILVWKSACAGAYLLYAKTGDDVWRGLAESYNGQYDKSLSAGRMDDLAKNSPAYKIRDVMYGHLRGIAVDRDYGLY